MNDQLEIQSVDENARSLHTLMFKLYSCAIHRCRKKSDILLSMVEVMIHEGSSQTMASWHDPKTLYDRWSKIGLASHASIRKFI